MQLLIKIFRWLKNPGEKLSRRVIHGGFWVFAIRIFRRLFGLLKIIVLARLLAPEDFGLFGIAMLALSTVQSLSRTGFNQAIIQKREDTIPYLNTAWTVGLARNFLLTLVLFFAAPLVGTFFSEPRAVLLIRVLSFTVFLNGLKNIGVIFFRKRLQFHKQFIYQSVDIVVNIAVTIPLAFILRSAWALVYGALAGKAVQLLLSYIIHPYRPRLGLDFEKAREMYDFGKWVYGSTVLFFIALNIDDIFAGKLLGAAALGIYQLSFRISNSMATEITNVMSQVTFPAFSKIQENIQALKRAFKNTLEASVSIGAPMAAGIFLLAPDFVHVVLEPKWEPMIPILRIMAIAGLIRSIIASGGPLFNSVGKPRMNFLMNLLRVAVICVFIYPLTMSFGLIGTAVTVLIGLSLTAILWLRFISNTIESGYRPIFKVLSFSMVGAIIMDLAIIGIKSLLPTMNLPLLFAVIFAGITVYMLYSIFIKMLYDEGPISSLAKILNYARGK